jgi:hypothetical protein
MAKQSRKPKTRKIKLADEILLKHHLIIKYRQLISKRYQYQNIKDAPGLPASITPEVVESLRQYFLRNLYPEPEMREKLDEAFSELENYVLHPTKVWGLVGNLTSAIFRYGFQLPAALKAGLSALEAYTSTKHFENTLLHAAMDKQFKIPLSDDEFKACLCAIPEDELEKFIDEVSQLFRAFTNTSLLGKTIDIMKDVVETMQSKPELYGKNEVEAIELGIDIMKKGLALFEDYTEETKEEMLQFVANNERQFIYDLYKVYRN